MRIIENSEIPQPIIKINYITCFVNMGKKIFITGLYITEFAVINLMKFH